MRILLAALVGIAVVMLVCIGALPVEPPARLLFGWMSFIGRVLPSVRVNWEAVASSVICLVAVLVLGQVMGAWVWRESGHPGRWRKRWTVAGVFGLMVMFVAGLAVTGVAHQVVWLAESEKPLVTRGRESTRRRMCASNMRTIGHAILDSVDRNGGRWPADLAAVLADGDVYVTNLVCPSSYHDVAPGKTPEEQAKNLEGHVSYVYYGQGWSGKVPADRVVMSELLDNHDGFGANVLFGDGRVEWLDGEAVRKVLMGPATRPVAVTPD